KYPFLLALGLGLTIGSTHVSAQHMSMQKFDVPISLAASSTAGSWYPDRYVPALFENHTFSGENVLRLQINSSGTAVNRPSSHSSQFYNTQGRKYDLGVGVTILKGDLYIPGDWADKHRRSDLWATTFSAASPASPLSYPIIGFANTEGNNPGIR